MSRRALILLGLTCACSPVGDASETFGRGDFGAGTGGAISGADPTSDSPGDDSSTGMSGEDTGGSGGDETGSGDSTGEEDGFMFVPGLYVHGIDGADSNDGSREAPMRTIQAALLQAEAQGLRAVYVASGTYTATHDSLESIELRPGISLYGGFSATDWEDRNPDLHLTEIVDASVATTGVSDLVPHRAVHAPVGVTADDVVDGFTITASGAAYASAVFVEGGSPTFANNILQGRATAAYTTVVRITGGAPFFENNEIDPVGATSTTMGVRCDEGQPRFIGNDIHSGALTGAYAVYYQSCGGSLAHNVIQAEAPSTGTTWGLELRDSAPDVLSNSISANPASGYTSYHVSLSGISTPRIANNNFVQASDLGSVYCIYAASGSQPSTLTNNNLVGDYLYYGSFSATTLLELETNLDVAASNVTVEAAVMDAVSGDLRLRDDGSVPCALARGGVSIPGLVPEIDREGALRTDPWSIGAFELDGECR